MSLFDHMYKLANPAPGQVTPGQADHVSPSDGSHPPSSVPPAALGMGPEQHGTGIPGLRPDFMPLPHQINAVRRLIENDGKMIMAHTMGTGKTATSIYGYEKLKQLGLANKALVVTPASLRQNFLESGVKRFTTDTGQIVNRPSEIDPNASFVVCSYEAFRARPAEFMQRSGADTLIVDEFHHLRNNDTEGYKALWIGRQFAKNFMGLTASPVNNAATELAPLLALSENNPHLTKQQFREKFVKTIGTTEGFAGGTKKLYGIKNEAEFAKDVYPKMDVVQTEDVKGNFTPRKIVNEIDVPMAPRQVRAYQAAMDQVPAFRKYIEDPDQNFTLPQTDQMFTRILRARQASNDAGLGRNDMTLEQRAAGTPKVHRIIQDVIQHLKEKPDNAAVISAEMVNGGADILSAGLDKAGIPHGLFLGKGTELGSRKITEESRQQDVRDFNTGKSRVLLISGAGSEGISLGNATYLAELSGHFNPEHVLQVEARAVRLGGQSARAPKDRVVQINRYKSVLPQTEQPGFFGKLVGQKPIRSVDSWMYDLARTKHQSNQPYLDTIHEPKKYLTKTISPNTGKPVYHYAPKPEQHGLFGRIFGSKPEDTKGPL